MRFDSVVIPLVQERMPALIAQHACHDAPVCVVYQDAQEPSSAFRAALRAAHHGHRVGRALRRSPASMHEMMSRVSRAAEDPADKAVQGTVLYLEDDVVVPGPLWEWLLSDAPEHPYGILPRVTYNSEGEAGEAMRHVHLSGLLLPAHAFATIARVLMRDPSPGNDCQVIAALEHELPSFARHETPAPLVHLTTPDLGSAFEDTYDEWGGNKLWVDQDGDAGGDPSC